MGIAKQYIPQSKEQEEIINQFRQYLKEETLINNVSRSNYVGQLAKFLVRNEIHTIEDFDEYYKDNPNPEKFNGMKHFFKRFNTKTNLNKLPRKKYDSQSVTSVRHKHGFNLLYDPEDDPLVMRYKKERGISESTMTGMKTALGLYIPLSEFKSVNEMLEEAFEDEKKGIQPKNARIKQHLMEYLVFLRDNYDSQHTVHTLYAKIETFYRHFDVTLPSRPPMKVTQSYHVSYDDLPTKEMIQTACQCVDLHWKALLLFMSSSGTAKTETLAMTVEDFVKGLTYHTEETHIDGVLEELVGRRDIVPCIPMVRKKTNIPYHTCCSPEASYYILESLNQRNGEQRLELEDKVFPFNGPKLMKKFQWLNDVNKWGWIGNYRRFRSHALRKFHASNIGCSFDVINMLEGRSNGVIHKTYVKVKPSELRETYMKYMRNVMINPDRFGSPDGQQPSNVQPSTAGGQPTANNSGTSSDVLLQLQEITKQIGMLEYRIQQLENK